MHGRLLDQPSADHFREAASGPSLWEIFWQRKAYVALGAVVGLALGVLYWSMAPKTYESSAQILVLKKRPDAPISAATASSPLASNLNPNEDFLDTHQTVIRSAVVLGDAVVKGRLSDRATFQASGYPTRDLARSLTVGRDRDKSSGNKSSSQILNISFRCAHAEDCGPILAAVIESYRDFLNNSTHDSTKEALKLITKARDLVQNDLESKEKAYAEFRLNTPVLWKTSYGTTLYQERLEKIDAQRASLGMRIAQIRTTLDAVDTAIKQGRSRAELLEIVSALPGETPVAQGARGPRGSQGTSQGARSTGALSSNLEQELIQLQLEEGKLLSNYGPEHPQVKSLRDRLQTIRSLLAPSTTPEAKSADQRSNDERAKENLVDLRIAQLQQELAESKRGVETLDTLFQSELREAKKAFPYETQEDSFRRSINQEQILYSHIIKRLEELDIVSGFGGYDAQVITPPTEAEKISPRGSLVLPMALFLGLLLGGGLAYLVELTDKSFRSPEDVRRRLGLPIMGLIPRLKYITKEFAHVGEGEAQLDPNICTWYRAVSTESEAYRGVRTALYFSTRGQGRKIIQITSPNQGDGKSLLAVNLAVSIAQSGKRVLLVDADLRRPNVDKLLGVSNSVGFASVLGGLADVNEAICDTVVPGLSVIPCGELPPNPSELLTAPRLHEALEWMRDHYDYVVVDTPPLLAVTDPSVVAPQVDGVILTLRSTKKGRVEAERAKEILDSLGVNIFGIVLNAITPAQNGEVYGYSGYENHEGAAQNDKVLPARPPRMKDEEQDRESKERPVSG